MKPPTPRYIERWKDIARKDWHRMRRALADDDAEDAGVHLQQSLEKYLKAFLLERGWRLQRIHRLGELVREASRHEPAVAAYEEMAAQVTALYMADRYPPSPEAPVTAGELGKHIAQARALVQLLFPDEVLP